MPANQGFALNLNLPSGGTPIPVTAISGTTPIVSSVVTIDGAISVVVTLVVTSTGAGTWKAEYSVGGDVWQNQATASGGVTLTAAAGSGQNTAFTLNVPEGFKLLRITFTPTSGAGNVSVTLGAILSNPIDCDTNSVASLQLSSPNTVAGTWTVGASNNYSDGTYGLPKNPGTFPTYGTAPTASTAGSDLLYPLGAVEFFKFRAYQIGFTQTGGAGAVIAAQFQRQV